MRGLLRQALQYLGVVEDGIEEIVLALTEACANVVQHAGEHEEYQVDVAIDDDVCRISVVDDGDGFDVDGGRGRAVAAATAAAGWCSCARWSTGWRSCRTRTAGTAVDPGEAAGHRAAAAAPADLSATAGCRR